MKTASLALGLYVDLGQSGRAFLGGAAYKYNAHEVDALNVSRCKMRKKL
jgi:hypothetical protein